jgi:hypothetical protein
MHFATRNVYPSNPEYLRGAARAAETDCSLQNSQSRLKKRPVAGLRRLSVRTTVSRTGLDSGDGGFCAGQ